jgi:hypothetical protein
MREMPTMHMSLARIYDEVCRHFPDLEQIYSSPTGDGVQTTRFRFEDQTELRFVETEFEQLEKYEFIAMMYAYRRNP